MTEWTDTLDALIDYLHYRQECGERATELEPELLALLNAQAPLPTTVPSSPPAPRRRDVPTQLSPVAPPMTMPVAAAAADDPPEARQAGLAALAASIETCQRCTLAQSRTRTVPGAGKIGSPEVMFIGEAPGADEDAQGLPFVGAAGQLLTKMIQAMGFTRDEVFIANICKCRPPKNRVPTHDEMNACLPYLRAQLAIIRPKVIVTLGAVAAKGLLATESGITSLRGHWARYGHIPLMPTFHPAYLLRYPAAKKESWADLQAVLKLLGRPVPTRPKAQG
jgi:DNA polymerase